MNAAIIERRVHESELRSRVRRAEAKRRRDALRRLRIALGIIAAFGCYMIGREIFTPIDYRPSPLIIVLGMWLVVPWIVAMRHQ